MAYKTPHWIAVAGAVTDSTFMPVAHCQVAVATATEAEAETIAHVDLTISDMFSETITANATGDTTFTLRKNGADTALTWTVPQNATGSHGNTANPISFTAGDTMSLKVSTTAGSITYLAGVSFKLEGADGETYQMIASFNEATINLSTTPRYFRPSGEFPTSVLSTESTAQNLVSNDGTIVGIMAYSSANTRTLNTLIKPRINGADGSIVATIPASTSGRYSATGTDAIVVDDLINSIYIGSGSGALTLSLVQMTIKSDNPREVTFYGGQNVSRLATTTSQYSMLGSRIFNTTSESTVPAYYNANGVLSRIAMFSSASTATQNLEVFARISGVDGNNTFTMSTAGWYVDTTNTDTITTTDYVTQRNNRVASGSGTTTLRNQSILFTMELIAPPSGLTIISSGWWL